MRETTSIAIIGTGNVAFHLGNALYENGIVIDQVYGRNTQIASELSKSWDCSVAASLSEIKSDLVLICVSDNAITSIISQLPEGIAIAYTSGSVQLSSIVGRSNIGVIYPMQSFSKNKAVNLFEVPFLIEADSTEFAQDLFNLAWKLSRKVFYTTSEERKKYHLAAVMVNNFTNHLAYQAKNYLDQQDLNWELLLPLLTETVDKILISDPYNAQTGPARRNDQETINTHVEMLDGLPKEMYKLISKSITDTYLPHD